MRTDFKIAEYPHFTTDRLKLILETLFQFAFFSLDQRLEIRSHPRLTYPLMHFSIPCQPGKLKCTGEILQGWTDASYIADC